MAYFAGDKNGTFKQLVIKNTTQLNNTLATMTAFIVINAHNSTRKL